VHRRLIACLNRRNRSILFLLAIRQILLLLSARAGVICLFWPVWRPRSPRPAFSSLFFTLLTLRALFYRDRFLRLRRLRFSTATVDLLFFLWSLDPVLYGLPRSATPVSGCSERRTLLMIKADLDPFSFPFAIFFSMDVVDSTSRAKDGILMHCRE